MIVTHYVNVTALVAVDEVVECLRSNGIPVTVETTNPFQKRLHIEVPDAITLSDALALGTIIGNVEAGVLMKR